VSWADEIDKACMRGGSPYGAVEVLGWMREGDARFFCSGELHASCFIDDAGIARVGHMAGVWNRQDAAWIIARCRQWLKKRGISEINIEGRPGWKRLLQREGFTK